MNVWQKLKEELEKKIGFEVEESEFGDLTAKAFGKDPKKILEKTKLPRWVDNYEIRGSYINFWVDWGEIGKKILDDVKSKGYGRSRQKKDVVIEYSSPNIAKPMHIGHLRNTVLGISLCRIYEFLGNKVRKINWYGDTGTQFGKLILAYKLWGNEIELENDPLREMMRVYVKFHEEVGEDPSLLEKAREVYKGLEKGDKEFMGLWKKFTKLSLEEFKRIYKRLNAEFDHYDGESKYTEKGKEIVRELQKKGLVKEGKEGALVMEFPDLPTTVIQKKDSTTLYLTRDIATAIQRKKEYGFDQMIYVVGPEQKMHFRQLFQSLKMMRYKWAENCHHVYYGFVSLPSGKMSTREGKVIFADDLMEQSIERAGEINKKSSEKVGLGALNYGLLKVDPKKDVVFRWENILNLKGDTGPYLQYSAVRAKHILKKVEPKEFEWPEISGVEKSLLKKLALFPEVVSEARKQFKPNLIANYSHELADMFNNFYEECPVTQEKDRDKKHFRAHLVEAFLLTIEKAMYLLNMEIPEKM